MVIGYTDYVKMQRSLIDRFLNKYGVKSLSLARYLNCTLNITITHTNLFHYFINVIENGQPVSHCVLLGETGMKIQIPPQKITKYNYN